MPDFHCDVRPKCECSTKDPRQRFGERIRRDLNQLSRHAAAPCAQLKKHPCSYVQSGGHMQARQRWMKVFDINPGRHVRTCTLCRNSGTAAIGAEID